MTALEEQPVTAPATAAPMQWRLNPRFLARVACVPYEAASRMSGSPLRAAGLAVTTAEETAAAVAATTASVLESAIGTETRPDVRRRLIDARRDVHNGRPVRRAEDLARSAGEPCAGALAAHAAALDAVRDCLRGAEQIAVDELSRARAVLREVARDQNLRAGIQLSSAELDRRLDGYLAEPAGAVLGKRHRQIELSLLEYLFRAACKTSPFSRLTAVVPGRLEDAADGLTVLGRSTQVASRARLNMALLGRMSAALLLDPDTRCVLDVVLVGGTRIAHEDAVYYWRKRIRMAEDGDAAVTLDAIQESQFALPRSDALSQVLDVLGDSGCTFAQLVDELLGYRPGTAREDVEAYVAHLVSLRLLACPQLRIDVHEDDPVDGFRARVAALGTPAALCAAEALGAMAQIAREFPEQGVTDRRRSLGRMSEIARDALTDIAGGRVAAPRTVLYEDSTMPGLQVRAGRSWWERHFATDLATVAALLPVFDMNQFRRLVMKAYFVRRFGAGGQVDDVLSFAHEFEQDFYQNFQQRLLRRRRYDGTTQNPVDNWFRQDEVAGLDRARERLRRLVQARLDAGGGGAAEIDLAGAELADLLADVPDTGDRIAPWCFFVQVQDDEERPRLVVNRIHTGTGMTFSRFLHLTPPEVTRDLREELGSLCDGGAVLAELTGGYETTNLNLHPPVLPFEIVCPGDFPSRPAADLIDVDDLVISHDPVTDRLRLLSRRLGVEVTPVYQGFLVPMALPEVQRILLNFSCSGPCALDLWDGIVHREDAVVALPRLRVGNVVLHRRRWHVPAEQWPAYDDARSDSAYCLAMSRWADEHALPRRVFVQLPGEAKPTYVDFDSALSIRTIGLLTRRLESAVVVTEMEPGPGRLWPQLDGRSHVAEFTIEINGTRVMRRDG